MKSIKLNVYDAKVDLVHQFTAEGAVAAPDLVSLARTCDVILLCLPTSAITRAVIFGKGGLAEGLSAGKIVVDQTSGDPEETRRMATELRTSGVTLVDAPVSGGPSGASAGTIAIMLGGEQAATAQARPVLEAISPNIVDCGQIGNGHAVKIVNNAISSLGRVVSYECVAAGYKYGLSIEDMSKVLHSSSGWSLASRKVLSALSTGKHTADFQMQLMVKDLRLASALAISCGAPMLISNAVRSLFETGLNRFGPISNIEEMSQLFEDMSGTKFQPNASIAE